jgi:hypothetical protein
VSQILTLGGHSSEEPQRGSPLNGHEEVIWPHCVPTCGDFPADRACRNTRTIGLASLEPRWIGGDFGTQRSGFGPLCQSDGARPLCVCSGFRELSPWRGICPCRILTSEEKFRLGAIRVDTALAECDRNTLVDSATFLRLQDCRGCWEFRFPFSCSCGRSVGCIRLGPNRRVPTRQRMNGIFYLVVLIVVALLVNYALGLW